MPDHQYLLTPRNTGFVSQTQTETEIHRRRQCTKILLEWNLQCIQIGGANCFLPLHDYVLAFITGITILLLQVVDWIATYGIIRSINVGLTVQPLIYLMMFSGISSPCFSGIRAPPVCWNQGPCCIIFWNQGHMENSASYS